MNSKQPDLYGELAYRLVRDGQVTICGARFQAGTGDEGLGCQRPVAHWGPHAAITVHQWPVGAS